MSWIKSFASSMLMQCLVIGIYTTILVYLLTTIRIELTTLL